MWSRNDWLAQLAPRVPLHQTKRFECNCGPGRTFKLTHDDKGFFAYCFREGEHDASGPTHESLAERVARLGRAARADTKLRGEVGLPDGERDPGLWPRPAYLWMLKAGLSRQDIGGLGARYDEASQRLVLPVYGQAGDVEFWQARSIDGRQPKYLAPAIDRTRVVARFGDSPTGPVTLVEDILSAYKIGLSGGVGWSMLGTKLSDYVLSELMKRGQPVNVWLDNDLPPLHAYNKGQIAATKVLAKLRAAGLTAQNIVSTVDPKLLPRSEIKEKLNVLRN